MCVIGNPPYSGISHNMSSWISGLIEDYKYVDGEHFGERKHWLHDDYVKFIRLSESLINKNGEGILGFITNHGYLDNPTFRGMRWHLLQTFDSIHVLDLHGNAKKKEITPEGKPDKNVFDIQQGVAIIVAVKKRGKKKGPAEVFRGDLWGTREGKYAALNHISIGKPVTERIVCEKPHYSFSTATATANTSTAFSKGFLITELFVEGSMGVQTSRDKLAIAQTREELKNRLRDFCNPKFSDEDIRKRYFSKKKAEKYLRGDSRGWSVSEARKKIDVDGFPDLVVPINYRPFDTRFTYFSSALLDWP
jgi:predicted helicase